VAARPLSEALDPERISDHRACVTVVVMAARALEGYDIDGAIRAAEHSRDFGCFFSPGAWMQNVDKLREDIELLKAALPLVQLAKRIRAHIDSGERKAFDPADEREEAE